MLTALGYYFRHGVLGFKLRDPFKWTLATAGDPEYASQVIGLPVAAFANCYGCYRIASASCGAARGRAETCARGCFGVFEIPAISGLHQAGRRKRAVAKDGERRQGAVENTLRRAEDEF